MNLKKSQPAPEPADESAVDTTSSPNKLLLIGGGVIGVAAAGALAFVLLSGGDDAAETPVAAPRPVPSATASATETASPTTSASIPTYAAKNARDPFKALVTQAAGGGKTAVATTSPAAWTPPPAPVQTWSPTSSTTSKTTSPSTTTTTTTAPTTPEPTIPYDVNLVVLSKIVDETTVEIYANDLPYTLTVGEVVDGPLELKSVDTTAQSAVVAYGEVLVTLPLHQVVILQQP